MFKRPCLDCGVLVDRGNRCEPHQSAYLAKIDERRKPNRKHYSGSYQRRAKQVRDNAVICWICNKAFTTDDPPTADHYYPSDPSSPLLAAHRSCNSRRGNQPPMP